MSQFVEWIFQRDFPSIYGQPVVRFPLVQQKYVWVSHQSQPSFLSLHQYFCRTFFSLTFFATFIKIILQVILMILRNISKICSINSHHNGLYIYIYRYVNPITLSTRNIHYFKKDLRMYIYIYIQLYIYICIYNILR